MAQESARILNAKRCCYALVQITVMKEKFKIGQYLNQDILHWITFNEKQNVFSLKVTRQSKWMLPCRSVCIWSYHLFQGVPLGLAEGLLESAYERFRLLNFLLQLGDLRTRQIKITPVIWLGRTVTFRAVHRFFTFVCILIPGELPNHTSFLVNKYLLF